ncbi:hypothetical protein NCER_100906 [Vairimorpha ceranae BRL01]|uniref:Thymidine kinase n=2 Tax=Vairimorpha ceranae TaxID=40302 RepID=C4V8R7_VAIC1|nr:thymidine kinase [Vairimorpha ceranae]EEQ82391.1 hypothetical protein NCER_100906 [Vairimorpha ceranae BRL01]KAF5139714.1 hypothetical protein G9O61_00g020970 [Vairimorpha ceranae]KKO75520.1 thymidine kinase [Vairimorpha ceranae]
MVKFFTGCVMSGKTRLLFDFINLCCSENYLVLAPKLVVKENGNKLTSRAVKDKYITPDLCLTENDSILKLFKEKLKRNKSIQIVFCDEIQFFTKQQIDDLFTLEEDYGIKVVCFGINKTHRNEDWPTIEYLKRRILDITTLEVKCMSCRAIANTNIRSDYNLEEETISINIKDGEEKYFPICNECYKKKTRKWFSLF